MNRFVGVFALVAVAMGAPAPEAGVYAAGAVAAPAAAVVPGAASYAGAPVASAPAVVGQTHQTYAAGAPTVQQHTEYGIVGHQVVQTGVQSVVAGHEYAVAGVEHVPQPATSYVAGPAKNSQVTVPIAPPAIPPAPRNLGPAPADTVTQQKILAPVRSHVRITPQATNIVHQLNVQKYNVDVPVHVPTPVAREIVVNKHVAAPYEVAVPRAVPVAAPYKVHRVQGTVEHVGYAAAGPAVATAHVTGVAHAAVAAPAVGAVGYAAAPALAAGVAAAPLAAGLHY